MTDRKTVVLRHVARAETRTAESGAKSDTGTHEIGRRAGEMAYEILVNGKNPVVAHEFLGSDVEGKDIIIIDDMLSSGDSCLEVARALKQRKAGRIFIFATFGLFTAGLEALDKLEAFLRYYRQ